MLKSKVRYFFRTYMPRYRGRDILESFPIYTYAHAPRL